MEDSLAWPFPGDPNANVGRRHHTIPRFYLAYWANERQEIMVVRKPTWRRFPANIDSVAAERDFYTFVGNDGELGGHMEQVLGQVEGDAKAAIDRIIHPTFGAFPPPPDDKHALATFIAFQFVRGRRKRKSIELLADFAQRLELSNLSEESVKERIQASGDTATPERVAELMDFLGNLDEYEFVPDPNEHIGMMGSLAWEVYKRLLRREWYLYEFDEPVLLTSDEPVVLFAEEPNPLRGIGVLNADEVWLPLNPSMLLVLALERLPIRKRVIHAPSMYAEFANRLSVHGAYQYIFLPQGRNVMPSELPEDQPLFNVTAPGFPMAGRYNKSPRIRGTQRRRKEDREQVTREQKSTPDASGATPV